MRSDELVNGNGVGCVDDEGVYIHYFDQVGQGSSHFDVSQLDFYCIDIQTASRKLDPMLPYAMNKA